MFNNRGFTPLENCDVDSENGHRVSCNGKEKKISPNSLTGFTLLELVVVVAIIGLLASVALIPNLIRFQQRAMSSRIKAAATQLASSYELAAAETCTNFDVTLGGVVKCDTPNQTYIQVFPAQPTGGPMFDLDGICDTTRGTSIVDFNPTTTALVFCANNFSNGGTFTCNQGSCSCSSETGCDR